MRKALTLIILLTVSLLGFSQTDKELAEQFIDQNLIKSHIGFLASDELEGRDTPSKGLEIAAKYIESRFIEYGIQKAPGMDSYFQTVPMKIVAPPSSGTLKLGDASYNFQDDFIMLEGDNGELAGEYVFVNHGLDSDLQELDLNGKIVVAICGDGESDSPQKWFGQSRQKRQRVSEMGAVALVELYNSPQIPWQFLVRYFSGEQVVLDEGDEEKPGLVHLWMNRASNDVSQESGSGSISIGRGQNRKVQFSECSWIYRRYGCKAERRIYCLLGTL